MGFEIDQFVQLVEGELYFEGELVDSGIQMAVLVEEFLGCEFGFGFHGMISYGLRVEQVGMKVK